MSLIVLLDAGPLLDQHGEPSFRLLSLRITARIREFRSEFFNLPNHPIFGQPGATVGTLTYGVIGSTRLDSRQIQFGLKLSF